MPPFVAKLLSRSPAFDPSVPSGAFSKQWTRPGDVFSILLILGGDVVARALAQLAGGRWTPPTFSFGWVAYSITALVSAVGENRLMPSPDCDCIVINGTTGYDRHNTSWILGRLVRDYDGWMDKSISSKTKEIIDVKWQESRTTAEANNRPMPARPKVAGLCVSFYYPRPKVEAGKPTVDVVCILAFLVAVVQLGVASIPCGLYGDWGILMITASGILLSFLTASLPQWANEKWACRRLDRDKTVVLTRGNGSQHAIVILGSPGFLDLEDLATGQTNLDLSTSLFTRVLIMTLALLWISLLITAAGVGENTWFLLAVGGIGIILNVCVAGWRRTPEAFGIPLKFDSKIGTRRVMETLYQVEEKHPYVGVCMRKTFFPGKIRPDERRRWDEYATTAEAREAARRAGHPYSIRDIPDPTPPTHNAHSLGHEF